MNPGLDGHDGEPTPPGEAGSRDMFQKNFHLSILTNRRSKGRMEPLEKGDRMNTNGPKDRADRIPVAARIIGVTLCEP